MSAHEHSWALLGINEYCTKALWVLNSPWCHDHECLSSLMSAVEAMAQYTWVFKAAYEYSWVLMSAQECPWVLIIAHECSWHHVFACSGLLMSIHEYSWALISSHEHSWAWHIGTMAPTAFISANKRSWAWRHGTITTHSGLAQYFSKVTGNVLLLGLTHPLALMLQQMWDKNFWNYWIPTSHQNTPCAQK